jgi:dGTPase
VARSEYGYDLDYDAARFNPTELPAVSPAGERDDLRSPYARDADRLIYTPAFRRLQGKTQVVTPGEADFFRTRLTHTIEVAQLARRLAESLNKNYLAEVSAHKNHELAPWKGERGFLDPDVCEAAAVLHDLGHPPFGHAGEAALAAVVANQEKRLGITEPGSFNGNAQSFRMAVRSLTHKKRRNGLELTRAVLDGALKYPWVYRDKTNSPKSDHRWNVNPTEAEAFAWVRERVPSSERSVPSVEAQLMDLSDDIAYSVHDLDDWFRAGFMPLPQLAGGGPELDRLIEVIDQRWRASGKIKGRKRSIHVRSMIRGLFADPADAFGAFAPPVAGESIIDPTTDAAREAVRNARSQLYDEFTSSVELRLRPGAKRTWPRRHALRIAIDDDQRLRIDILRELLWIYVVGNPLMATHQAGQAKVVRTVFNAFAKAVRRMGEDATAIEIFPVDARALLDGTDSPEERLRIVVDYVSGMTDAYCSRVNARLTGRDAPFNEYL